MSNINVIKKIINTTTDKLDSIESPISLNKTNLIDETVNALTRQQIEFLADLLLRRNALPVGIAPRSLEDLHDCLAREFLDCILYDRPDENENYMYESELELYLG